MTRCVIATCTLTALTLFAPSIEAQTPGQLAQFADEHPGRKHNERERNDSQHQPALIDSEITQTANGSIGIGTRTPIAKLDLFGGNLNLEESADGTGNILKAGSLFIHTFGFQNTFVGIGTGNFGLTSGRNTALGVDALHHLTSGATNTAVGVDALHSCTECSANTAVGWLALHSLTTGHSNTACGLDSLGNLSTGQSNTACGVVSLNQNTTGSNNTAFGGGAMFNNTTGTLNAAVGINALIGNVTGDRNTAVGYNAGVSRGDLVNATAVGAEATVDGSNKIRLGNNQVTVIEGRVPYTFTSDRHQKENFRTVNAERILQGLAGLNVSSWNYIGDGAQQIRHYGPVAQEFFAAFGYDGVGIIGTPTTINSGDMEGVLMIAVQALEKRTAEAELLRSRIDALERMVQELQTAAR